MGPRTCPRPHSKKVLMLGSKPTQGLDTRSLCFAHSAAKGVFEVCSWPFSWPRPACCSRSSGLLLSDCVSEFPQCFCSGHETGARPSSRESVVWPGLQLYLQPSNQEFLYLLKSAKWAQRWVSDSRG